MKTILAIDDQASVLQTLRWLVEANGYRCVTAATAEEAEMVFRENAVDVVIVDHGLPGIDGSRLALYLKKIKPVPVIMLSGNPDLKPPSGAVDVFLAKPQNPSDLLRAIGKMVAHEDREN